MFRRFQLILSAFCCLGVSSNIMAGETTSIAPAVAPAESAYDPVENWQFDFYTGALFSFGGNASELNYTILPQFLSFRTPGHISFYHGDAGDLVVRARFTLMAEGIVRGPESYFLGIQGGPVLEWWNAERTWSLFASAGGGVGWMDSKGYEVEGGQGQDFNLNWYAQVGFTYQFTDNFSAGLSAFYQHISNGGADEVNPGIDAIGPMLQLMWHF